MADQGDAVDRYRADGILGIIAATAAGEVGFGRVNGRAPASVAVKIHAGQARQPINLEVAGQAGIIHRAIAGQA